MTYQEMVERVFQSLDKPKRILPVPLPKILAMRRVAFCPME